MSFEMKADLQSNIGTGTRKLFYDDAYKKSFEAYVISCDESEEGFAVVLNETAFFPEEGGQSPDTGVFILPDGESVSVKDVQIKDGIITHYTDGPVDEDINVTGMIDFEHRFSNMQNHTAEHILSGICCSRFGVENVGFHLSDNEITVDYDKPISEEDLAAIEREVNIIIQKNIELSQWFPTQDELPEIDFRSKKDISGQVRLIVIPGVDICACCAPHVKSTGEIGLFKIISSQNYKGGVRVNMMAGMRAFDYVASVYDAMQSTSRFMTTSYLEVRDRVESLKNDNIELSRKLAMAESGKLIDEALSMPDDGKVILFTKDLEMQIIRKSASEIYEKRGGIVAIFSLINNVYQYIVIGDGDVGEYQKGLSALGARGGGKAPAIQGSVEADEASIKNWFDSIVRV